MEPFDQFHPFNDDNDEDGIFVTMMYLYYTDVYYNPIQLHCSHGVRC